MAAAGFRLGGPDFSDDSGDDDDDRHGGTTEDATFRTDIVVNTHGRNPHHVPIPPLSVSNCWGTLDNCEVQMQRYIQSQDTTSRHMGAAVESIDEVDMIPEDKVIRMGRHAARIYERHLCILNNIRVKAETSWWQFYQRYIRRKNYTILIQYQIRLYQKKGQLKRQMDHLMEDIQRVMRQYRGYKRDATKLIRKDAKGKPLTKSLIARIVQNNESILYLHRQMEEFDRQLMRLHEQWGGLNTQYGTVINTIANVNRVTDDATLVDNEEQMHEELRKMQEKRLQDNDKKAQRINMHASWTEEHNRNTRQISSLVQQTEDEQKRAHAVPGAGGAAGAGALLAMTSFDGFDDLIEEDDDMEGGMTARPIRAPAPASPPPAPAGEGGLSTEYPEMEPDEDGGGAAPAARNGNLENTALLANGHGAR